MVAKKNRDDFNNTKNNWLNGTKNIVKDFPEQLLCLADAMVGVSVLMAPSKLDFRLNHQRATSYPGHDKMAEWNVVEYT